LVIHIYFWNYSKLTKTSNCQRCYLQTTKSQ